MELVEKEKVTRAMMVPTMLKQIIDHPDFNKYNLSSLKIITYGAAPMPINVIRRAVELFPDVSFINAFGQTETASTITVLGPEDHVITGSEEEKRLKLKRLSSIGKPLPDIEMRIVNKHGKEVPTGKIGEIVARGPRVMNGYWQGEKITKNVIDEDGWVYTGDVGYVDVDGYFYLVGRSTDMIIRGGENISPAEVEAVLNGHPKIEEAAVIGIQDEEWGEQPIAIVALKPGVKITAEEVMEDCRAKMASFKRPRAVMFVNKLPRNSLGKLLRRELREEYGKQSISLQE